MSDCLHCEINQLVQERSQFVIATHSPILMAYPDARSHLSTLGRGKL